MLTQLLWQRCVRKDWSRTTDTDRSRGWRYRRYYLFRHCIGDEGSTTVMRYCSSMAIVQTAEFIVFEALLCVTWGTHAFYRHRAPYIIRYRRLPHWFVASSWINTLCGLSSACKLHSIFVDLAMTQNLLITVLIWCTNILGYNNR